MKRVVLLLSALLLQYELPFRAQTPFVFQTTFDCPEWNQTKGLADSDICAQEDGISGWGGWTTAAGKVDEITAEANNPLGTGRGFRHWRGGASANNRQGTSNNAGGIRLNIPSKPQEVWIRWYMRYQAGFDWQHILQTKDLYVNAGSFAGSFTLGFHGENGWGVAIVQPQSQNLFGSPGWRGTMKGALADGLWHAYETHIKTSKPTIAESWIDGRRVHRDTKVDFAEVTLDFILVGSNQCCVTVQPDMYTDYDDFAVSTTGYIGPIGAAPQPPPR